MKNATMVLGKSSSAVYTSLMGFVPANLKDDVRSVLERIPLVIIPVTELNLHYRIWQIIS